MNYKLLLIFLTAIIISFYIGFTMNNENLAIEIKYPLTVDDVLTMIYGNVEKYYIFEPNQMTGVTYSQSYGESYDTLFFPNGTRTFTEIDDDGIILKKFIIQDFPEKAVMILILEE